VVTITGALADNPIAGVNDLGLDDHQGRPEYRDAQPRNGICQGRHPL
jgi:hypothetical protein